MRVKQGTTAAEEAAIQGHLKRLGLEMDDRREIQEPKEKEFNGGPEVRELTHLLRLGKIATQTHAELTLDDLASVHEVPEPGVRAYVARLAGKDARTIAESTLKSTAMTLSAATQTLNAIARKGGVEESRERPLAQLMRDVCDGLGACLGPDVAGYASPADLAALQKSHAELLRAFAKAAPVLEQNKHAPVRDAAASGLRAVATGVFFEPGAKIEDFKPWASPAEKAADVLIEWAQNQFSVDSQGHVDHRLPIHFPGTITGMVADLVLSGRAFTVRVPHWKVGRPDEKEVIAALKRQGLKPLQVGFEGEGLGPAVTDLFAIFRTSDFKTGPFAIDVDPADQARSQANAEAVAETFDRIFTDGGSRPKNGGDYVLVPLDRSERFPAAADARREIEKLGYDVKHVAIEPGVGMRPSGVGVVIARD